MTRTAELRAINLIPAFLQRLKPKGICIPELRPGKRAGK